MYLMSEVELKAFFDCSRELREAAMTMTSEDVKSHSTEILESAQINEIVEGEKLSLEVDIDGVAHIPIQGMLTNHVSPSAGFFGESITTFEFLTEAIAQAEDIDQVKELLFEINSGGGEVDGLEAVANAIFNTKKPTSARVHGLAASAAFWLASQTDKIIATGRTSSVGSIGVAAEFIDRSAQDKSNGVKHVILTSTDAPQKRLDIKTAEGQKQTISRLDEIHTVFVDHIVRGISARHPNVNADFVNKNFGKGSVMAADAALKVGMIDEIEGISTQTTNNGGTLAASAETPKDLPETPKKQDKKMETLTEFLASNAQAKVEHNNLIADAETKGREELKTELKATAESVKPFMMSDSYVARVKEACFEAVTGERTLASVLDFVALSDQIKEKDKSTTVVDKQPDATPGEGDATPEAQAKALTAANATSLSKDINNTNQVT